jgi:hypothetical protein
MAEETIWQLEIDGSGALDTLEAILEGVDAVAEAISEFVASATDLSAFDDIFAGISAAVLESLDSFGCMKKL